MRSARLPGSRTGSGRMIRLLKIENSAVLAPITRARVPTVTTENPGLLRKARSAARGADILVQAIEQTHRPYGALWA